MKAAATAPFPRGLVSVLATGRIPCCTGSDRRGDDGLARRRRDRSGACGSTVWLTRKHCARFSARGRRRRG